MKNNHNTLNSSKSIILFSTADWDNPYWTNKQHMAKYLGEHGFNVLYIESIGLRTPTVSKRDIKRMLKRIWRGFQPAKSVSQNLWVISPIAIPFKQHWSFVRTINQRLLGIRIHLFIMRHKFKKPMIWTYHPFMLHAIDLFKHEQVIYHCVDDLGAIPGIDKTKFYIEENKLLLKSNLIFVTSKALEKRCLNYNKNTYFFPNVVDEEHFKQAHHPTSIPSEMVVIPRPRIGYVGVLSDYKVDFKLIYDIACSRKEWNWVLIGEEREGQKNNTVELLRRLPNVYFLSHKKYDDLPNYLALLDVGTLPTLLSDYTKSMFPMKYYEYLAAGIPVVTTPLDFTDMTKSYTIVADSESAFENAILQQIQRGKLTIEESVMAVGDNTWAIRLSKMLSIICAKSSN